MKNVIGLLLCLGSGFVCAAEGIGSDETQKAAIGTAESLLKGGVNGLQQNLTNQATGMAAAEVNQAGKSFLDKYFPYAEFNVGFGIPSKPTYGALVVVPLNSREDVVNTIFNQTSVYHVDGRTTVNVGLGYRRLAYDNKALFGINAFYDQEFPYDHQRTSLGLEARTTVAEINANRYWGISGWKSVDNGYEERAMGGADIELGIPLPYMPWAKIYGRKFEWYAFDGVANLKGTDLSLKAQVPLLPGLIIEAGHRDYQNYAGSNFLRVSYNLIASKKAKNTQIFTDTAWSLRSMEEHRYDKVRRENLIVKQRQSRFKVNFVNQ